MESADVITATTLALAFVVGCVVSRYMVPRKAAPQSDRDLYYAGLDRDAARCHRCSLTPSTRTVLCGYDPAAPSLSSLARFAPIRQQTQCIFARNARIWGSRDGWEPNAADAISNVRLSLAAFALFASLQDGIDGFVFEVKGAKSLPDLCAAVRDVLCGLAALDPTGRDCMAKSWACKKGWVFEFNQNEFFVTSFAPCYDESSSRYAFGAADGESCFVLLQPYHSFLLHNVGSDTPLTAWDRPRTARDRIRVAFKAKGRPYPIPPNPDAYPVAHNFVYPLDSMDGGIVRWWREEDEEWIETEVQ